MPAYNDKSVCIMGRCNGSSENVFSVVVDRYDMSAFYHFLHELENTNSFDYLIIENYKLKSFF